LTQPHSTHRFLLPMLKHVSESAGSASILAGIWSAAKPAMVRNGGVSGAVLH
jgi:hypothetical protein